MNDLRPSAFVRNSRIAALEAIRRHIADTGFPPSYAELGHRIGLAPQRVGAVLRDLEAAGHLRLEPGRRRGITLLAEDLGRHATSELLIELERRGLLVNVAPSGRRVASAWPAPRTEYELTFHSSINHMPRRGRRGPNGKTAAQSSTQSEGEAEGDRANGEVD